LNEALEQIQQSECELNEEALQESEQLQEETAPYAADGFIDEGSAEDPSESEDELSRLREENRRLINELYQAKKISEQLSDFSQIFPEQDVREIPNEVWEDVKNGNSLAAAFALFERKRTVSENRAKEINELNAYRSSGRVGNNTVSEYFSPEQVRAMSQSEVRANYSKIIESMKKWN